MCPSWTSPAGEVNKKGNLKSFVGLYASWLSNFESDSKTAVSTCKTGSHKMWSHDGEIFKGNWEITGAMLNVWMLSLALKLCKYTESTYCAFTYPETGFVFSFFSALFCTSKVLKTFTRGSLAVQPQSSFISDGAADHRTGNHLVEGFLWERSEIKHFHLTLHFIVCHLHWLRLIFTLLTSH